MEKKLEIIGPYTPEHEGPFCTRDGKPVRLLTKTEGVSGFPVVGFINNATHPAVWDTEGKIYYLNRGPNFEAESDLMDAREVPVAREFWVNEFAGVVPKNAVAHRFERDARSFEDDPCYLRTIHVRGVLPGEGA